MFQNRAGDVIAKIALLGMIAFMAWNWRVIIFLTMTLLYVWMHGNAN
jgi:hypothetical protein